MERIQLGPWDLRVDREATLEFYASLPPLQCACGNCRNFIAAYPDLPADVRSLFDQLGVDPRREGGEVYVYEPDSILYGGVMVLVGELVDEPDDFAVTNGSVTTFNETVFTDTISGGFTREDDLVALCVPVQPEPHIVFRFNVDRVPWVLPEDQLR